MDYSLLVFVVIKPFKEVVHSRLMDENESRDPFVTENHFATVI